jgi:hypothetical protein
MTHSQLCEMAVRWLQRPASKGGHGCQVSLAETRSGWVGEIPDAIGFRMVSAATAGDGCVLVECKTSRSDWLRDRRKPHRQVDSLGNWRYYLCPEGLIRPEEVPPGWGLLYAKGRSIKPVLGAAAEFTGSTTQDRTALRFWKQPSCHEKEQFILVHLLQRLNRRYKDCEARARRSARNADALREQLRNNGINPRC